MSYLTGEINEGGYIMATQGPLFYMVHRETTGMHLKGPTHPTLREAKERLLSREVPLLIKLRRDGGVEKLWVPKDKASECRERLEQWRTCYGGWPLAEFNA